MWLATNDLQDTAFVNYEMPQASGVWAQVSGAPLVAVRRPKPRQEKVLLC
jgi:hypothetical protein